MLEFVPVPYTADFKLETALMSVHRNIPRYIIHEDGTYETVTEPLEPAGNEEDAENGIQTYSFEAVGGDYVTTPERFQYTIPWDMNIVYEGIDMMTGMLRFAVPTALWIFLLISGVYIVVNIFHVLGR